MQYPKGAGNFNNRQTRGVITHKREIENNTNLLNLGLYNFMYAPAMYKQISHIKLYPPPYILSPCIVLMVSKNTNKTI